MMTRPRVVITGMGITSPLGRGIPRTWEALHGVESGITEVKHFDASAYRTRIGGECLDYIPRKCDPKDVDRYDRFLLMSMTAAEEAWESAGLDSIKDRTEFGVSVGSGMGGIDQIQLNHSILLDKSKGPSRMRPFFVPGIIINMTGGWIAERWGLMGPNHASVSACSTGNHSIANAYFTIQRGDAQVMLTGGSEAAALLASAIGREVLSISAVTGTGLPRLSESLWALVRESRGPTATEESPPQAARPPHRETI